MIPMTPASLQEAPPIRGWHVIYIILMFFILTRNQSSFLSLAFGIPS